MTTESPESDGPLGTTLRVGTVVACRLNEDARPPADVLEIDLGPRMIAGVRSDVLVLGTATEDRSLVH